MQLGAQEEVAEPLQQVAGKDSIGEPPGRSALGLKIGGLMIPPNGGFLKWRYP